MTFEEKLKSVADIEFQFIEKPTDGGEILHNNGLHYKKQSFCEGARWARQETLREVMPVLYAAAKCGVYPAIKLIKKLEAVREASDV